MDVNFDNVVNASGPGHVTGAAGSVLVVAPEFPFPANHGGIIDIAGRVRGLRELGYAVDLLCSAKTPPTEAQRAEARLHVRDVFVAPRVNSLRTALTPRPLQVESRRGLRSTRVFRRYDLVLLESHYVLAATANETIRADVWVLRVHNDEVVYYRELARSAGWSLKRLAYLADAARFVWTERQARRRLSHFMCISAHEAGRLRRALPAAHVEFVPPPVPAPRARPAPPADAAAAGASVLFAGSLFMINNQEAVLWYLRHVHPRLLGRDRYDFVVAGNSRGGVPPAVRAALAAPRVRFVDSPPDMRPVYDAARVFVNPMRHGAGLKVKTVEAVANGLPVVSTRTGAEGTGLRHGEHALITNDPAEFAAHVARLLDDPALARRQVDAAAEFLRTEYDQAANLRRFLGHAMRGRAA